MHRLRACDEILTRTPAILDGWLGGLPERWVSARERADTWSPFDVLGHLIFGEQTDWMPRARIILEDGEARTFDPFDREGHVEPSRGRTLDQLLDQFGQLRRANLAALRALDLDAADLERRGTHPELGVVTLGELLAMWVAHDLTHLRQIARAMTTTARADVGPWTAYMRD